MGQVAPMRLVRRRGRTGWPWRLFFLQANAAAARECRARVLEALDLGKPRLQIELAVAPSSPGEFHLAHRPADFPSGADAGLAAYRSCCCSERMVRSRACLAACRPPEPERIIPPQAHFEAGRSTRRRSSRPAIQRQGFASSRVTADQHGAIDSGPGLKHGWFRLSLEGPVADLSASRMRIERALGLLGQKCMLPLLGIEGLRPGDPGDPQVGLQPGHQSLRVRSRPEGRATRSGVCVGVEWSCVRW